jgi:hypothetical protein
LTVFRADALLVAFGAAALARGAALAGRFFAAFAVFLTFAELFREAAFFALRPDACGAGFRARPAALRPLPLALFPAELRAAFRLAIAWSFPPRGLP